MSHTEKRARQIDTDLQEAGVKRVLNTAEAAELLQVDRRTLYAYAREGRIKASRIGKGNLYLRVEVARFLAAVEY